MIINSIKKIRRRARASIVGIFRPRPGYPLLYYSWWHAELHSPKIKLTQVNYLTAIPNSGAGIGHQLANWIAGLWFAHLFGLDFAHTPFSSQKWEQLLGLGEHEITADHLVQGQGYRKVRLPLFDEYNVTEVEKINKIIASFSDEKVVFELEQDQFYRDQYGVMDEIKTKFYGSVARQQEYLMYSSEYFNIAVHIRRGDIATGQESGDPNLLIRWQNNDYFQQVLSTVVDQIDTNKPIAIYLFSQGSREDFKSFDNFGNLNYCLDMSAEDAFVHMVFADLLITSKSSFSYKPALLSKGIKVCPKIFWHGYPESNDWILVNDDASIDSSETSKFEKH